MWEAAVVPCPQVQPVVKLSIFSRWVLPNMFYLYIYIFVCMHICIYMASHTDPIQTENTPACPTSIHLNTQHSQKHEQHWRTDPVPSLQLTRTEVGTGIYMHTTWVSPVTSFRRSMQYLALKTPGVPKLLPPGHLSPDGSWLHSSCWYSYLSSYSPDTSTCSLLLFTELFQSRECAHPEDS